MINEEKLALMFELAQEQQRSVQDLIKKAQESQQRMEQNALSSANIATKAVGDEVFKEVKASFEKYEGHLDGILAKSERILETSNRANQELDNAAKRLSYKLLLGLAIFAFACTASLFGVSFWLTNTIKEQQKTIEYLNSQGGDFQFSNCNGQVCIKVKDQPTYGDNGEYRIVIRK